jgi:hypothetical protein
LRCVNLLLGMSIHKVRDVITRKHAIVFHYPRLFRKRYGRSSEVKVVHFIFFSSLMRSPIVNSSVWYDNVNSKLI